MIPKAMNKKTARDATGGIPPVRKTAVQSVIDLTANAVQVTVIGVEYFNPSRAEILVEE